MEETGQLARCETKRDTALIIPKPAYTAIQYWWMLGPASINAVVKRCGGAPVSQNRNPGRTEKRDAREQKRIKEQKGGQPIKNGKERTAVRPAQCVQSVSECQQPCWRVEEVNEPHQMGAPRSLVLSGSGASAPPPAAPRWTHDVGSMASMAAGLLAAMAVARPPRHS
ncbi:hypothetical protein MRX96_036758 [Rhipicephalus microplus]